MLICGHDMRLVERTDVRGLRAYSAGLELASQHVTSAGVVTQVWVYCGAICRRSLPGFAIQTMCDVV